MFGYFIMYFIAVTLTYLLLKTYCGLNTLLIDSSLFALSQFSILSTFCFCIVFAWHFSLLFSQRFFEWHDLCTLKVHFVVSSVRFFHVSVQVPLVTKIIGSKTIFSFIKYVTWFISHNFIGCTGVVLDNQICCMVLKVVLCYQARAGLSRIKKIPY